MSVNKLELTFQIMLEHPSPPPYSQPWFTPSHPLGISLNPTSSWNVLLPSTHIQYYKSFSYCLPTPVGL